MVQHVKYNLAGIIDDVGFDCDSLQSELRSNPFTQSLLQRGTYISLVNLPLKRLNGPMLQLYQPNNYLVNRARPIGSSVTNMLFFESRSKSKMP